MNNFKITTIPEHIVHIFKNKKVIYFTDPFFTAKVDTIEQEYEEGLKNELYTLNLKFPNIKLMDTPPFKEDFDILFFDYGGMSLGNDLLGSFCRHIVRTAPEYPSRYYVMVSTFTKWAMKDAKEGYDLPNIYLTIDDFAKQFKIDDYYETLGIDVVEERQKLYNSLNNCKDIRIWCFNNIELW